MSVGNEQDIIDSRDIHKRIQEIHDEGEGFERDVDAAKTQLAFVKLNSPDDETSIEEHEGEVADAEEKLSEHNRDTKGELETLEELKEAVGEDHLIRHTYWVQYAEELVKDIGDLPKNIPDYIVIDWEATADNLLQDYSEVDYDGVTYYYRSH